MKLPACSTVVTCSEAQFNTRYPGYPRWLRNNTERLEGENAPLKLRGMT